MRPNLSASISHTTTRRTDADTATQSASRMVNQIASLNRNQIRSLLKTKALVVDGEILVLGGLVRDEVQETESKVPFLGSIPILGWLFKGTEKTILKNNK